MAARRLDWRYATVARRPSPCVLCGKPALLRHPVTGEPCHKVCADNATPTRTDPTPQEKL